MYGFAADAAGITGTLVPFTAPLSNSDPIGLLAQSAALGQSGGQAAGQQPMNLASNLPGGMDPQPCCRWVRSSSARFPKRCKDLRLR